MSFSRYSVLSADYDPTKIRRPSSISAISKPPSVTSRRRKAPPTFRPGQICVVHESVFTPLSEALSQADGAIDIREGRSLTFKRGKLAAVSSGEERPCIIMDPPAGYHSPRGAQNKGQFICLMATFASSHGNYGKFGKLLQRFVVPVEPNEQILPDSNMDALTTTPAWRNPWQWAIAFIIYTERPVKLYRARSDGQGRRLSNIEYDRLVQHCDNQRRLWLLDATENLNLKQEMYEKLVVSPIAFASPMLCITV
ncbi:hypothetical protein EDD18DRAFT_183143 [Armillaria luteobubalina]|uniref:Uncharacterized protein n=1 Tax=Armillaria luteobubalina TaxID=153913 RepID=A0AA39Q7F0_9AGAR|nr:hypothetical protein EDD18DRAFT_183143 [Armillaria luteobubalina]